MVRARDCILSLGGIQAANSYVKINLSLFGLYPREFCPSVPPGDDAAARQLHLPDVVVDARHRHSAFDRACDEPEAARAGRVRPEGAVRSRRHALELVRRTASS